MHINAQRVLKYTLYKSKDWYVPGIIGNTDDTNAISLRGYEKVYDNEQ